MESMVVTELGKFDSITIFEEDKEKLLTQLVKYLDSPKHVLINLAAIKAPSEDLLDLINFVSTILKSDSYSLQLFYPCNSTIKKLSDHRFRNLPMTDDIARFVSLLDNIEREIRTQSLLKSYVDETMKYFFSKTGLILKRGELSIENEPSEFLNKMNFFQSFEMENSFFTFVIGAEEDFFKSFLESMKETQLSPVISNIIQNIPKDHLSGIKVHDYLAHPYTNFPTEKIKIKNKSYDYFKNCSVMVIPLSCALGEFNLEVWIPKIFTKDVYSFLNP